jgi:transposase-like protein
VITKLTETWAAEQRAFAARDLSTVDYVYVFADGSHVNLRLKEHRLCLLVLIGVRADGPKELIARSDGHRDSGESWADLLRDCARRGMRARSSEDLSPRSPVIAHATVPGHAASNRITF